MEKISVSIDKAKQIATLTLDGKSVTMTFANLQALAQNVLMNPKSLIEFDLTISDTPI